MARNATPAAPSRPARPAPAGDSGSPLPKKLGIRPATTIPLWLVGTKAAYAQGLHAWARRTDWRALWVCWPKTASGVRTDLSDGAVRTLALAAGLVDDKVCAVDATWSGLCFARRRDAHPGPGE